MTTPDPAAAPYELTDFCRAIYPRLVGALGLQCRPDIAEELAQEVMAKVCQHWSRVRNMDSPEAWVFRVGFNLVNSFFRRKAAERRARRRLEQNAEVPVADPNEALSDVRRAVASLPARQRAAVVFRYYLDFSVLETAEAMDCSPGTVKSLTHKGIAALRNHAALTDLKEVSGAV